jgi:histidinol-phosphate/aromatic aminotransferase/cobyric acid decarboxylase-like protein
MSVTCAWCGITPGTSFVCARCETEQRRSPHDAARALGRRGGQVRGASKRRGDADYYRAMRARRKENKRDRSGQSSG